MLFRLRMRWTTIPQFVPLKINPIIAEAKAMKRLAVPFQVAELVQVALEHLLLAAREIRPGYEAAKSHAAFWPIPLRWSD